MYVLAVINYDIGHLSESVKQKSILNVPKHCLTLLKAHLVEHRTGIAEVMGSNPIEAMIFFFRLLLSSCLNWKIYCDDHTSLSIKILLTKSGILAINFLMQLK